MADAESLEAGEATRLALAVERAEQRSEIWDSREQLEALGEHLMPILADTGIEFSGEPEVFEIHNIVRR